MGGGGGGGSSSFQIPAIRRGLSPARAAAEAARQQTTAAVSEAMALLAIFHGSGTGGGVGGDVGEQEEDVVMTEGGELDLESSVSSFVSLQDSGLLVQPPLKRVTRKDSKVLMNLHTSSLQRPPVSHAKAINSVPSCSRRIPYFWCLRIGIFHNSGRI